MLLIIEIDTSKEIMLLGIFAALRVGTQIKGWTREIVPNTENDAAAKYDEATTRSQLSWHIHASVVIWVLDCHPQNTRRSSVGATLCFTPAPSITFFAPPPPLPPSLPHFSRAPLTRTSASAPPVASTPHGCTSALSTGSFLPASPPCHVICGVVIFIACL